MLEHGPTTPTSGPRELIPRLAAAVLIADGRVSEAERCAVDQLRALGLGSLSTSVDAEVARATRVPIDVARTASALARLAPRAGTVIVSSLAHIAASDHDLSRRELEVLGVIADAFDLSGPETDQIIRAAAEACHADVAESSPEAAAMAPHPARDAESPRSPVPPAAAPSSPPLSSRELNWALPILGLDACSSAAELDTAYVALVRRYNPAAVLDLGPEFAVLAVQRLNRITAAYVAARDALAGASSEA